MAHLSTCPCVQNARTQIYMGTGSGRKSRGVVEGMHTNFACIWRTFVLTLPKHLSRSPAPLHPCLHPHLTSLSLSLSTSSLSGSHFVCIRSTHTRNRPSLFSIFLVVSFFFSHVSCLTALNNSLFCMKQGPHLLLPPLTASTHSPGPGPQYLGLFPFFISLVVLNHACAPFFFIAPRYASCSRGRRSGSQQDGSCTWRACTAG